jgi:hypothetical protein
MSSGLTRLMEDLGLKNFDELNEFLNNPKNLDNPIVKGYQELKKYIKEQEELERLSPEEIKERFGIVDEGDIVSQEDLEE